MFENAVCDVVSCSTDSTQNLATLPATTANYLAIEVISDAMCAWCWLGKRRLEKALAALAPEITATATWRPFELNSDMPKAGLDRRECPSLQNLKKS